MRILFLQKVDNANGGITNVNINLISYFLSLNYQVELLSIRHGDTWENVSYPQGVNKHLINENDVWGCPRLNNLLSELKRGNLIKGTKLLAERFAYKRQIADDYKKCKKIIEKLMPDVIINSHYELLAGIGQQYLQKTIMHFHTSFDQVLANRSYLKTFKKFAPRIYTFVWLSEATKNEAVSHGFENSKCIYNPLSFSEQRCADMSNKKMIFVGRLSKEKRVHLAIEYFKEVVRENGFDEWKFEIYGSGELVDEIKSAIEDNHQIIYKGQTEQVNEVMLGSSLLVLTSSFEGMPLVVMEANECGVPALVYDFGESSREVILDEITGIIVPQNDKKMFEAMMKRFFKDEDYRLKLSCECKKFAKHFALENIGSQWVKLFEEMK